MPNDMKSSGQRGGGGTRRGMNPLFAGIIIGLLLGIGIALGVAIWLNRANQHSFVEKSKPVEPLPPIKQPTTSTAPSKDAPKDGKTEPRFEFYQILPGEKDPSRPSAAAERQSTSTESASKDSPKDTKADKGEKPEPRVIKSADETLFLQAGAYQSVADAENMKAKIAFAGFEATVKPVNVPEKGTLYRVRLGPYKSQDEVNRIKGVLSQNGISAAVVRPE